MSDWNIFEVFIGSSGQLECERNAVEEAIKEWNDSAGKIMRTILLPRRWEQLSPQSHTKVQDYINRTQVERADILIAFFGNNASEGTVSEIDLFLASGKSQTAMIYFTANEPHSPEVNKLKKRFESLGLTGSFTDAQDLAHRVKEDLTSRVDQLQEYARYSWPRLKRAVADLQNHAPHLLARFLTEELLSKPTKEMERVRDEARAFGTYAGYNGYRETVHDYLDQERGRTGTRVYAICGEKGLRGDQEARDYFQKFYDFPDPQFKENQVFRVFVELDPEPGNEQERHRPITCEVIKTHKNTPQVVALTVDRSNRTLIDQKFPGLCTALDKGFGLLLFERSDKSKIAIVHQGGREDFTYAVFDGYTNVVKHLMDMTYELYKTANEYQSLKKEIDSLFNTI